jgi:hypothetical protein
MTYSSSEEINNLPLEIANETGNECTELINCTEVSNFEDCEFTSTEEVGNYLREKIPLSHLENCPSIRYESQPSEICPNALGFINRHSREIKICSICEGKEELLETVTHEVGHNTHYNVMSNNPELANKWIEINQASYTQNSYDGTGFVSSYAMTNEREDFAESYASYITDPEKLIFYSPEKYEFMKNEVFYGREYN